MGSSFSVIVGLQHTYIAYAVVCLYLGFERGVYDFEKLMTEVVVPTLVWPGTELMPGNNKDF